MKMKMKMKKKQEGIERRKKLGDDLFAILRDASSDEIHQLFIAMVTTKFSDIFEDLKYGILLNESIFNKSKDLFSLILYLSFKIVSPLKPIHLTYYFFQFLIL